MPSLFPSSLTRKKIGPDAPPANEGASAPAAVLIPDTTIAQVTAGITGAPKTAPAASVDAQAEATRQEAQDLLEGVRVALNALPDYVPLKTAGAILLDATIGLSAQTLSVLQPVLEDFRVTVQNTLDTGITDEPVKAPTPSVSLLSRVTDFVETRSREELVRLATNLQNKISEDITRHQNKQNAAVIMESQILRGYSSLIGTVVSGAGKISANNADVWSEYNPSALDSQNIGKQLDRAAYGSSLEYAHAVAQTLSTHGILKQSSDNQKQFQEDLTRDFSYLTAILKSASSSSLGLSEAIKQLTQPALSQAETRYKSLLRRHKPKSLAVPPIPAAVPVPPLIRTPEENALIELLPGFDPNLFLPPRSG